MRTPARTSASWSILTPTGSHSSRTAGRFFGEELTQVVAADFILGKTPGPVATNLSSSRAIEDVAARYGQEVERSPVGEIHVVRAMQAAAP